VLALGLVCSALRAQEPKAIPIPPPATPPAPAAVAPPPATAVAATVNGQPILELAVYRALLRDDPAQREKLRTEVINFLVENALIDQYLDQQKVAVDAKDIDTRFGEVKAKLIEGLKKPFEDILKELHLTEADLRTQIHNTLRWDKFIAQYATEKALREFFDANRATFDGSQMRARHILVAAPANDAKAVEAAKAKLLGLKKQIEDQVEAGLKAVASQDKLAQEKARMQLLADAFSAAASKESACPSKSAGGELGWFPRSGRMVEPFAKAAFALKPYQMSDIVATEFGLHLILATDSKPGRDVKYEEMQEIVKEVYGDRIRETVVARLRPTAQIVINPAPKQ